MDNRTSFKLSKKNYDLLKSIDFSSFESLEVSLKFNDKDLTFETDDIMMLQIALNYEISLNGLTKDQEECTEYGRKLYALYDEIYYQIE